MYSDICSRCSLYLSPLYSPLFICKACPVVLQLQHSLPPWCIFSSFQLDSDIYVHLLCTIVRHLEGLVFFFSPTHPFPFFPLSLLSRATVTESLMNRKTPQWRVGFMFCFYFDYNQELVSGTLGIFTIRWMMLQTGAKAAKPCGTHAPSVIQIDPLCLYNA